MRIGLVEINFTKVESRVLLLMLEGYTDMGIAEKLSLSPHDVHTYKERIQRKTQKNSILKKTRKALNPFIYN